MKYGLALSLLVLTLEFTGFAQDVRPAVPAGAVAETTGIIAEPAGAAAVPVIAVFPYFCPNADDAEEFSWALFAVPDMIRERLLEGDRFILLEKSELTAAAASSGLSADYYVREESRLAVAQQVGADFYSWGYLIRSETGLKVFHGMVNARTGRTLHLESFLLPEDQSLISVMEDSVLAFEEWARRSLPEVARVERPLPAAVRNSRFALSVSAGYLTHPLVFSDTLQPSLMANLLLAYRPKGQSFYTIGMSASFSILNSLNPETQPIEIAMLPLLFSIGINPELSSVLDLDVAVSGGASLIFGRVNMEFLSYLRPTLSQESALVWFPRNKLSLTCGYQVFLVVNSYQAQTMIAFEPKIGLRIKF